MSILNKYINLVMELSCSLAVALIICVQYINIICNIYIGQSVMSYLVIIALLLTITNIPCKIIFSKKFICVLLLIMFYFLYTMIFMFNKCDLEILEFIALCILPFVIGASLRPNYKYVIRFCMLFLCLGIPVFDEFYTKGNAGTSYDAITMGNSYAIIPILLIGIIYGVFELKKMSLYEKLFFLISIIFYVQFLLMSYRGAFLASVLTIIIAFYTRSNKLSIEKIIFLLGVFLILFFLIFYWEEVISYIIELLNSLEIQIAVLQKMLYLSSYNGDLLHGRMEIWRYAFEGFLSSPIFGNGISTFLYNTGYIFPHNLFLQFLYDGGLLLTIPLCYLLFKGVIVLFNSIRYEDRYLYVFALSIMGVGLGRSFFSANTWRVVPLWLFLGIVSRKYIGKGEFIDE